MTTEERYEYERADQENDAASALGEAHDLRDEAHDVLTRLAHVVDMAQCALDSKSVGEVLNYMAEARSAARRVAEITGGWG